MAVGYPFIHIDGSRLNLSYMDEVLKVGLEGPVWRTEGHWCSSPLQWFDHLVGPREAPEMGKDQLPFWAVSSFRLALSYLGQGHFLGDWA